jgi:hypothetical protein
MGLFTALMSTFSDIPADVIFNRRNDLKKKLVDLLKNNVLFNESIRIDTKSGIVYRHEQIEAIASAVLGDKFTPRIVVKTDMENSNPVTA